MVMPTDKQRITLVHSAINDNFDLTIDQVVSHSDDFGRFKAWLGGDHAKIKEVLEAVQSAGMSPAYFAAYEYNEGYNPSWGWLNYTTPHGSPVQDAKFVAAHMVSVSKDMTATPSWIDAGNPVDFVPASVKAAGNADFKKMPSGTIGRAYIPSTAAATWSAYYPNGLKKEYNQVQDYADALAELYNTITFWGGKIDGSQSSNGNNTGNKTDGKPPKKDDFVTDSTELFKRVVKEIFKADVYNNNTQQFYKNAFVKLYKQLDNMYKLRPNFDLDKINLDNLNEATGAKKPVDPKPTPPSPDKWRLPFDGSLQSHEDGQQFGITGYWRGTWFHDGYDFGSAHYSGNIHAVTDAKVKYVGVMGSGLGAVVVLNNGTYDIMYQEFSTNLSGVTVSVGDTVTKGQKIAVLQSSHLHLGITKKDFNNALASWNVDDGTWLNPIPILQNK